MTDEVVLAEPGLHDGDEGWLRVTDEPHIRSVEAHHFSGEYGDVWLVTVAAMEFVRAVPLEDEIRRDVRDALVPVSGVEDVAEEDRETWQVEGDASGEALVTAVAAVIDRLAPRIREHFDRP